MGENVAELIKEFGTAISQGKDIVENDEQLIFFDVMGFFMVSIRQTL